MAKDYYDDMESQHFRHGGRDGGPGPSKTLIVTIVLGIAICVVVIIVWYRFFPQAQSKSSQQVIITQPATEIPQISDAPVVEQPPVLVVPEEKEPVVEERRQAISLSEQRPSVGQTNSLVVQYATHRVESGEDLASIAALYGLQTQTLISVNQIRNIQAIVEGATLRIPDRDGQLYTVREGDMLSTIARKYSPTLGWKTLQEVNALKSEIITVGQQLFIPDTTSATATPLADRSPIQFQKPTAGSVTALFGQPWVNPATGMTEQLSGILIQGTWGQAVVASSAGQVVDAGYEVQGRGRFVTLSHEGGYRTSYHHLENVEVKIGMNLQKGGTIGSIGSSGTDWQRPTLFFSIEQSGIALDPNQFF